jgi:hypothetical protein
VKNNLTSLGITNGGAAAFFVLTLTACLFVGACDNYKGKLTKSNFEKIHDKMPRTEVEALLGPGQIAPPQPGEMTGFFDHNSRLVNITRKLWQDGKRSITVAFFGDEVAPAGDGGALKQKEGF